MQQLAGIDLSAESSTPLFRLGQIAMDEKGNTYIYLKNKASSSAANLIFTYAGDVATAASSFIVSAALTTTEAAAYENHPLAVSLFAVTASYYAWFFCGPGKVTITGAGPIAAQATIYTTATDGKVDDAYTGTIVIPGLTVYEALATAGTIVAYATNRLYVVRS